ncbi:MAG: transposase [Marinirhabdus sp.]
MIYKCDYHMVWVLKYRLRILKGTIKGLVEKDVRMLCEWKSCEAEEPNVQEGHIAFVSFRSLPHRDFL